MVIIKYTILIAVLLSSSYIGVIIAQKYQNRVTELKEMKILLSIFLTKIKLTYEPIPQIFEELGNLGSTNTNKIFQKTCEKMKEKTAGEAWQEAIEEQNANFNKEDKQVLKNLSNLLGKVDLEGQIREIELVENFLNVQIEKAEKESIKNTKLYKTLGVVVGLAIVIILI